MIQKVLRIWALSFTALGLLAAAAPAVPEDVSVRIASPKPGEAARGTVTIKVEGRDIAQVVVSRDGAFLESDAEKPFEIRWDTRLERDGPHQLSARAQTRAGKWVVSPQVPVIVDNTPPSIRMLSPEPGALVAGKITLRCEARDNVRLKGIRFFADKVMLGEVSGPPHELAWNPAPFPNGMHLLKAAASDEAGNVRESEPVPVRIANPNNPPIIAPVGAKTIEEGRRFSFTVVAADPDGSRDRVTFSAPELPSWMTLDPATGEFSGTPDYGVASLQEPEKLLTLRFQACDPQPLCSAGTVQLKVVNVNRPPALAGMPEVVVHEGEPVAVAVPRAVDPDGDPVEYDAAPLPPWMKFDRDRLRLSGTPGFENMDQEQPDAEYPPVKIQACDPAGLCAEIQLKIRLSDTDRPPAFDPLPEKVAVEAGKPLALTVRATDPDRDPIRLEAKSLPDGAVFVDGANGTGTLRWTPTSDYFGNIAIEFIAASGGLTDSHRLILALREIRLPAVSGQVLDADGEPVAGVVVRVDDGKAVVGEAVSDARGFYLVEGLAPGRYFVRPEVTTISTEFSVEARSRGGTHFTPLSCSVTLEKSDLQKADFTALPVEQ